MIFRHLQIAKIQLIKYLLRISSLSRYAFPRLSYGINIVKNDRCLTANIASLQRPEVGKSRKYVKGVRYRSIAHSLLGIILRLSRLACFKSLGTITCAHIMFNECSCKIKIKKKKSSNYCTNIPSNEELQFQVYIYIYILYRHSMK